LKFKSLDNIFNTNTILAPNKRKKILSFTTEKFYATLCKALPFSLVPFCTPEFLEEEEEGKLKKIFGCGRVLGLVC
jgi:hypothetical protein